MTGAADGRGRTTSDTTYLGRLLDMIELVAGETAATSFRHAARMLGVPPSTAHRLLSLLLERGYCDRTEDGFFRPGPRLIRLGARALEEVPHWAAASKTVADLSELTGETATFGLLVGDRIVLTARHNSPHVLTVVSTVGDILSPHTSAMGKAVLANLDRERRKRIVEQYLPGDVDPIVQALDAELATVRETGYSIDEESFAPGLRCRAVAILDPVSATPIGGLSVSGPTVRFTFDRAESIVPDLHAAASRLVSWQSASLNADPVAALDGGPSVALSAST